MPTLNQARQRCDDFLTPRWQRLVDAQAAYLAQNGHYWQGLVTHTAPPNHTTSTTNDAPGDRLQDRPTDQAERWADFLPALVGLSFPVALVVDVYEVAAGHGFAVTLLVRYNGNTYRRVQATGPLANAYTKAWHRFDEVVE